MLFRSIVGFNLAPAYGFVMAKAPQPSHRIRAITSKSLPSGFTMAASSFGEIGHARRGINRITVTHGHAIAARAKALLQPLHHVLIPFDGLQRGCSTSHLPGQLVFAEGKLRHFHRAAARAGKDFTDGEARAFYVRAHAPRLVAAFFC